MARTRVKFQKFSFKSQVDQLAGRETPYPVYYFGRTVKFERPEIPGTTYRWARDNPVS